MTADEPAAPAEARPGPGTGRRRVWRTVAIATAIFACLVAGIAGLVLEAPRYLARWVADRYLAGLDIDVDGVKTIDIDLPEGRLSFGPVQFHAAGAQPGAIELLGLQISLRDLFEKQALLERVVVQGVDVTIRQAPDGELSINGVSLRQILAEQAEHAEQAPPPKPESASAWGAGIDHLQLKDIAVTFVNQHGGTARLTVQSLELSSFRTWEPEQPGDFDLVAVLNGIDLRAKGKARPFAEKITAEADFEIDGVDRERVETYTGPLGLDRAAGSAAFKGHSAFSLFPDGRLEGTANTTLTAADVDAAKAGEGDLRLGAASLATDGRFQVAAGGGFGFDGTVELKLEHAGAGTADGTGLAMDAASLGLQDVAVRRAASGDLSFAASTKLEASGAAVKGPAAAGWSKLTIDVPRVEAAVGADGRTSVQAKAASEPAGPAVRLLIAEPAVTAPVDFAAKAVSLELPTLSAETEAGGKTTLSTTATLSVEAGAVKLRSPEGAAGPRFAFASFTAQAGDLALGMEGGQTKLSSKLGAMAKGFQAALPAASAAPAKPERPAATRRRTAAAPAVAAAGAETRIAADAIDLSIPAATLQASASGMTAGGDGRIQVAKPSATVPAAGAPTEASAADADLRISGLKLQMVGDKLAASGAAVLALQAIRAVAPQEGASPWTVGLSRARLGLDALDASVAPPATKVAGKIDFAADGLEATQAAPAVASTGGKTAAGDATGSRTRIAFENVGLSLSPAEFQQAGERLSVRASGRTESTSLAVELPRTPQNPAASAAVGSSRTSLQEISFEQAGAAPSWSAKVDILAEKISAKAENGTLASIDLQSAAIADLEANDKQRLSIERIVLDKLQAFITRDYVFATSTTESRPKEAAEAVQKAAEEGWKVRVGSAGIGSGSVIRFRDSSLEPPTNATLDIRSLQVLNLNTGDPSQRTDFRLDAAIDQFTELGVSGWAAPFGKQPDFDVDARLRRLELPPLSPYAAKAVGVNVESGRLSLDVSAAAERGTLKGLLDITLRDLGFSTLSAADAQRLSASVGVPIETVVGLLQDDEGRIHLNLPISGDLANPSFDPSDAIRQALAGALQAAVLAPFQLAFAPVALLAKAAGGGSGADKVGLQPMPFPAGVAKLDSAARDQAMGLARVLEQRDKLRLKVCGRATAQDLEAALRAEGAPATDPGRAAAAEKLAPELWSLAGERTANVRAAIVTEGGAKPVQVGECRILYDPKDNGQPRVDVTF